MVPGGTATVCAQVYNTGLFAESNIDVAFYDGNPASGGQQIGSAAIAGPLAPGDNAQAQFNWTVPVGNTTHDVYAVAHDTNATSNEAYLPVVLPDLSLALSYQPTGAGKYAITASVANTGGIDISGATLTLSYLNQTTGNPVAITTPPCRLASRPGSPPGYRSCGSRRATPLQRGDPGHGRDRPAVRDAVLFGGEHHGLCGDPNAGSVHHRIQSHLWRDQRRSVQHLRTGLQRPDHAGAGAVSLTSGGGQVGITTSITSNSLTITPDAPLAYDTGYTLTVPRTR